MCRRRPISLSISKRGTNRIGSSNQSRFAGREDEEDNVLKRPVWNGPGTDWEQRALLERALSAPPPTMTAEDIRMAMFSRTSQVYDVSLRRSPRGRCVLVIDGDRTLPERDTAAYMRKLAGIAEIVSERGAVHVVQNCIRRLPREGLGPQDRRCFVL
jgi:hypothetical protein